MGTEGALVNPVLCFWLLTWGVSVTGLRDVVVRVPEAVRRGEHTRLYCDYNLEGDALYSVKWYFGRREFYRFTPRETPRLKVFPIHGLSDLVVQKSCSNATQLCLHKVALALSGRYSCEVSADSPSFRTAHVSGYMDVVVTPQHGPELRNIKPRYRVGEVLSASCISRNSKPPANLTWSINGSPVKGDNITLVKSLQEASTLLLTALSTIKLVLRQEHFTQGGRLKVRCTAGLYSLYWQITENSAEMDRPKAAVVAASNAVDTNPLVRPEDRLVEKVTELASGATSDALGLPLQYSAFCLFYNILLICR